MASFRELNMEWSMLCQECPDCWSKTDLQLAAELGKTLLERNKELENSLKQHQNVIEDQTQEIEYLTKQTVALREVNDSRLRIYEQLEVSIQDLERANHRLALENSSDKKQIKTLTNNIETLESKNEELQNAIEDLNLQLEGYRRQKLQDYHQQSSAVGPQFEVKQPQQGITLRCVAGARIPQSLTQEVHVQCDSSSEEPRSLQHITVQTEGNSSPLQDDVFESDNASEQIAQLATQLKDTRSMRNRDQRRISELEDQISVMVLENQTLEKQLVQMHQKEEESVTKSIHEELTTLEEVRQGQLCSRCLRNVDTRSRDDNMSLILDPEDEDDDSSMMDALCERPYRSSASMEVQDYTKLLSPPRETGNLYRDLVEKYEALLEVHRHPTSRTHGVNNKTGNALSLQEEMQMSGDFSNLHTKDTDEESGLDSFRGSSTSEKPANCKNDRKAFSRTPTDFSEAETSSSGFSDETSNKATQTEGRPGAFLCTIADGEDCRFSIYDDASPIDSRFRNRPEYRELFKEIFTVLKKAAENKDEGEQLPLLDDIKPAAGAPRVPPVTPAAEECPGDFTDDTQSVLSSTMSEMSNGLIERPTFNENLITPQNENVPKREQPSAHANRLEAAPVPTSNPATPTKSERVLTPLVRQPLDYIQVAVKVRKRSSSRRSNKKQQQFVDTSTSPILPTMGSPKVSFTNRIGAGGRRRGRDRVQGGNPPNSGEWNGATMQFWSTNRSNVASPTPSQGSQKSVWEFKPSTASQDLHKLKRLDLSYAEVLRNADNKKRERENYGKSGRRK